MNHKNVKHSVAPSKQLTSYLQAVH